MSEQKASEILKELINDEVAGINDINTKINSLLQEKAKRKEKAIAFNESYRQLTGKSLVDFSDGKSLADLTEALLLEHRELTADEIVKMLAKQGHQVKKNSLVAMLVRYIAQGKRFRRAEGRNRFGLEANRKENNTGQN